MKRINYFFSVVLMLTAFSLMPDRADAIPQYGDVDMNMDVEIADVVRLIDDIISGEPTIMDDIDGDLNVNITDVIILIDYLMTGQWTFNLYYPPVPDSAMVVTVNGVSFAMMPVKGGVFYPYKHGFGDHSETNTQVTLSDFYIGMTEVTVDLWEAVMGSRASCSLRYWAKPNEPVVFVSWWQCKEFIDKLNELTGMEFHLPTTDQWGYAATGGLWSHDYRYAGSNELDEVAWHSSNTPLLHQRYDEKWPGHGYTMPVGLKKPNELGLYDMSGNMMEFLAMSNRGWGDTYTEDLPSDYRFAEAAGGGLFSDTMFCEVYERKTFKNVNLTHTDCGLRLALQASSLNR